MRNKNRTRQILTALIICILLLGSCTVVKIGEEEADNGDQYSTWTKTGTGFQAADYVEAIWEDKIIPIYEAEAVEYMAIMSALEEDRQTNIEKFGLSRKTGEPFHIFKVRGTAEVIEFDDSSRNGVIRIDHEPYDGVVDAVIQVGPVLRGTTLRDSVEFIRFTDVGNQLQFADLAKELNLRMKTESIDVIDLETIEGKRIEYIGAFGLDAEQTLEEIVVTPLKFMLLEDSDG